MNTSMMMMQGTGELLLHIKNYTKQAECNLPSIPKQLPLLPGLPPL
jgi:hypothetical protein